MDMGPPISKELQLISFHTVSKGYWGECGQRGGYFEMTNIPPQVLSYSLVIEFSLYPCSTSTEFFHLWFCHTLKADPLPCLTSFLFVMYKRSHPIFSANVLLMMQTVDEIYKIASISLSPNVPAQVFVRHALTPFFSTFRYV